MADVPYPLSARTIPELRRQVGELIRQIYEDKIGGAEIGDVFSLGGEVLTLALASAGGLAKVSGELTIELDGTTLTLSSAGLKVTEVSSGWAITNKTADRDLDCNVGDVNVVADVLGTLIDDLKDAGILGA